MGSGKLGLSILMCIFSLRWSLCLNMPVLPCTYLVCPGFLRCHFIQFLPFRWHLVGLFNKSVSGTIIWSANFEVRLI